jgi:hypothetical protein
MIKFQAFTHKTADLKEMTDHVLGHLDYSLQSTGSYLRLLHTYQNVLHLQDHCTTSRKVLLHSLCSIRVENLLDISLLQI